MASCGLLPKPASDDLLGCALRTGGRVNVGSVDQVAAALDVLIEDLAGRLLIRLLAEGHRPERKLRHQYTRAAQQSFPHDQPPHPRFAVNFARFA